MKYIYNQNNTVTTFMKDLVSHRLRILEIISLLFFCHFFVIWPCHFFVIVKSYLSFFCHFSVIFLSFFLSFFCHFYTYFLNVRTGHLDYLREGFAWPARPFKHTESNSFETYCHYIEVF